MSSRNPSDGTPDACAILAGAGTFPRHVAQAAKRQGLRVVGIGMEGWADRSLAQVVDAYEEITVGQLGRLLERLKAQQVRRVIMAGKVTKDVLLHGDMQFDAEAQALLRRVQGVSVNSLLGAVAERLAQDGIVLLDSSTFLEGDLCPAGVVSRRTPTPEESEDIQAGLPIARQVSAWDIGQTVVVKRRVIVAIEALEGTDAAIERGAQLAGRGCVVVKMASPTQDMRFDLPILGPETMAVAARCGVSCLAVEARKTLLLDPTHLAALADASGLCLVGIEPEAPR